MKHFFALCWLAVAALAACGGRSPEPVAPQPDPPEQPEQQPIACTEIGCVNGFSLSLEPSERWPAGKYELTLELDQERVTCTGMLPLAACDAGPSFTCSAQNVRVGESGCALPPDAHGLSDIQIDAAPRSVVVRIARDGAEIAKLDLTPSYQRSQPNGPGCPPICDSANAKLKVF